MYWRPGFLLACLSLIASVSVDAQKSCSKKLTEKSGIIQTPNYPDNYPANADCYWEFVKPEDGACVVFTVEDFQIPSQEELLCPGDHFALESCGSFMDISPERYYCGDLTETIDARGSFELVQHYQINASSLRVSFHSDSVNEGRGFLMQYRILDSDQCRQYGSAGYTKIDGYDCVAVLDDEYGTIKTPNYPNEYPAEAACAYLFERPSPEYCGVFLRARKFDLEEKDGNICHDFFAIPGCRKTCGTIDFTRLMFVEYQPGATVLPLQFSSDFSVQGRGFTMQYLQLTDCFNPYQAECPNDQLSLFADPTECSNFERHDCSANEECDDGKICCFDGCMRKCVDPVQSVRRKREVSLLQEWIMDLNVTAPTFYNTPVDYKVKQRVPANIHWDLPALPSL